MNGRRRRGGILGYLLASHLLFAAALVYAFGGRPWWILGTELVLLLSLLVGFRLLRRIAASQELLGTAVELLRERDFGSHLLPVGQHDADALVELFNRMSDRLREERLRLEEQSFLLDKVLAASPVGVVTLDHDGRVTMLNAAAAQLLRVTATRAGTSPAPTPADGVPGVASFSASGVGAGLVPARLDELPGSLAAELASLAPGESRLVPLEGRRRLKCYRGQFFDRGFPRSFFLLEEVTEELRTSEKAAYEQLVRMISHEVSNSVGAVGSLLESCLAWGEQLQPGDREDYGQALGVAGARLRSLNAFVNGFAEVVRLPPPDRRPHDLGALVDEVLRLLAPELERRRITCGWGRREALPALSLDRHQMEQVLVNVLKNALEAIGESGEIALSLAREDGRPTLRIADSGVGITREAEGRLFVPFFSTKRDGRGLGLVLTREVVGQHGFGCGLANRAGGGAEFVLRM
ncbi:MAG TPA: ATP-binding protein [Thermoanaerobaculia bacterium]|nr:ATP-binding protein [Thermoanaerobaculia bacterium]